MCSLAAPRFFRSRVDIREFSSNIFRIHYYNYFNNFCFRFLFWFLPYTQF